MTINFETYLEARRIEYEMRNRRVSQLERLGPLPDPSLPTRSLSLGIRALAVRLRAALTADRAICDEPHDTRRTATGA